MYKIRKKLSCMNFLFNFLRFFPFGFSKLTFSDLTVLGIASAHVRWHDWQNLTSFHNKDKAMVWQEIFGPILGCH